MSVKGILEKDKQIFEEIMKEANEGTILSDTIQEIIFRIGTLRDAINELDDDDDKYYSNETNDEGETLFLLSCSPTKKDLIKLFKHIQSKLEAAMRYLTDGDLDEYQQGKAALEILEELTIKITKLLCGYVITINNQQQGDKK